MRSLQCHEDSASYWDVEASLRFTYSLEPKYMKIKHGWGQEQCFSQIKPYQTLRRWPMSRLPSFGGSFAVSKGVTPVIIFRELSEMPWVHRWWNQVIGFMHRLSNMPEDSIPAEVLRDNIADAQEHPSYGNWAGGFVKQYSRLGMVSPFSSSGITCLNSLGFQANMKGQLCRVWDGLHVSPRTAPSKGAKTLHILCMVSASQSAENCALLSASNAHFQGTAAGAIPHGVSCLAGGTG